MRTKQSSMRLRTVRRHRLALALVGAMAMPAAMAQSLPSGGSVVGGDANATIGSSGVQMTVNQNVQGAIINWDSFNIGAGYGVTFNQPNASSVTLNRVVGSGYGPSASVIDGSLSANGHVFIVNTAGITFGNNAQVNVGGLVASSVDISDADFNAGVGSNRYVFRGLGGAGQVRNDGTITATKVGTEGGRVAFVGNDLYNTGTINANGGSVAFGAASSVTLDFLGDGLTQVTVNGLSAPTVIAAAQNYGDITADGGQILMRAAVNPAGDGGVINGGTLRAQSLSTRAGRVELTASGGGILLGDLRDGFLGAGVIDVSGNGAGLAGGSVLLDAATVRLASDSTPPPPPASRSASSINASGDASGGTVQIRASSTLLMESNTSISTASGVGIGGNVQVLAGTLLMQGTVDDGARIDASGGSGGGAVDIFATTNALMQQNASVRADAISDGDGGSVRVIAGDNAISLGLLSAHGGKGGGNGGGIVLQGQIGGAATGGTINVDGLGVGGSGGDVFIVGATLTGVGNGGSVSADGDIDGGSVIVNGRNGQAILGETAAISADGRTGAGGLVGLVGDTTDAYGSISAHGGTTGGQVATASRAGGNLDLRGLEVDAGGGSVAGLWRIGASALTVLSGSDQGTFATAATGNIVQDADINFAMNTGTSIRLVASDGTGNGDVNFGTGVAIATANPLDLNFDVDADGSITGGDVFSIAGSGGTLAMHFNADADGAGDGFGHIDFRGATLNSNGGDILMYGQSDPVNGMASGFATGIQLLGSTIDTGGGDLLLRGASTASDANSDDAGVVLDATSIDSGGGSVALHGRGADITGGVALRGTNIGSAGGGIDIAGSADAGAGVEIGANSNVDAGSGVVQLRAGNDGSSDAIRIGGTIASSTAVNLRPGGVDANGALIERTADEILVGGATGFALGGAELAMIDTPELVIGSNLHAGAIRVLAAASRGGNLTLQNDGGSAGIDVQAALDVGSGTLALLSGGSITQTAAGAITAHSLLARAGGSVLLANAANNVAANTLAGTAAGEFAFQDADAIAIGTVAGQGFNTTASALAGNSVTGITAGGNVFVRNLSGDMTLNANVSGANIDLVTANTLQNLGGASLVASGDWRVWANTWGGETRGGLAGDGALPNLYGCNFQGACVPVVPTADNHFIYVQQPTAVIAFDNATREYGLPNPAFTYAVTGAILGDTAANVAAGAGTTSATIGSDVGSYAINGSLTSPAGYVFRYVPGALAITPAPLILAADQQIRFLGIPNPALTGAAIGLRNGDTIADVFGSDAIWSTPAGLLSPIGFYAITGGGTAGNYTVSQAPGNATALQVIPLPQLSSTPIDYIRETVDTYVYDRNFGSAPMCAVNASLEDQQLASTGDELSNEWSKVRSRPNLTNCFDTERRNSCGDF